MTPRRALLILVIAGSALRLALGAALGPSNDEAYYALFAVHPDWSFFDHPPMVGLVAWLGMAVAPGQALALRAAFIALFAGSTLIMARLAGRWYGPGAGFLAALALNVTGYYGIAAGTFALPDGPLVFFWLLTLDRLAAATESGRRFWPWAWVGLAWGGALLSKYHAVFLPAGFLLWCLLDPAARRWLKAPGPYLALAVGLAIFSPVVWWNAQHGWVSFLFQARRALGWSGVRLDLLAAMLVGQLAYLFPWMWGVVVVVGLKRARRFFGAASSAERFLLCQAFWPLAAFAALACVRPVLPHWSLVGFLALLPLVGQSWAERLAANPRRMRARLVLVAAVPAVLVVILGLQGRTGLFQKEGGLGLIAAKADPTLEMFGWDQVARGLTERGLLDEPDTFLVTSTWFQSGQVAFATQNRLPVVCYHPRDSRGFALWSKPADWLGQTGILVALDNRSVEPGCYERYFARIVPLGEFPITRAGQPVHKIRLFRCENQIQPFPFDDSDPTFPRPRAVAASWFGLGRRR